MSDVDDLVDFLRAQFDEDERVARASLPGPWEIEPYDALGGPAASILMPIPGQPGARTGLTRAALLGTQDAATAEHIARHDPARVLAEVDAKRRIIRMYELAAVARDAGSISQWNRAVDHGAADVLGDALRLLALPYASRPGWREEWRA